MKLQTKYGIRNSDVRRTKTKISTKKELNNLFYSASLSFSLFITHAQQSYIKSVFARDEASNLEIHEQQSIHVQFATIGKNNAIP